MSNRETKPSAGQLNTARIARQLTCSVGLTPMTRLYTTNGNLTSTIILPDPIKFGVKTHKETACTQIGEGGFHDCDN